MTGVSHCVLCIGFWLAALLLPVGAAADPLSLKRVMLSTGGVGYFEHEALIEGNAELHLEVPLEQVDDVLKSLIVQDDSGDMATIGLPGREPLTHIFRDLPFTQDALSSPLALFNALQGAEVEAKGQRQLKGRLLRVVPETAVLAGNQGTITQHRISLLTADGVRHFLFEEADAVRFVDPALGRQLDQALTAIAHHRLRDKRTLRITFAGNGRRAVRVGYVVSAPLWKTSYRLTLDKRDGASKGSLRGFAVLENMSGHDWADVELSLVSGNPVTFRQAVYASYYVDRPAVPVEVLGRVLPVPDSGTLGLAPLSATSQTHPQAPGAALRSEDKRTHLRMLSEELSVATSPTKQADVSSPLTDRLQPQAVADSEDLAAQVLFRLPIAVSVPTGQSLVVPIANREIPVTRLSLYQHETHQTHPLAAVQLVNDGPAALPAGILALYERARNEKLAFVGDAQLGTWPAGDERLVSFAVDQGTRISKEVKSERSIAQATIDRGILRLTVVRRETTTYRMKAPEHEERQLLIEHPRRPGWQLIAMEEKPVVLTDDRYRIPVRLPGGSESTLDVHLEHPETEQIQIRSLSLDRILGYARSTELDQPVRQAFVEMARLHREVDDQRQRVDRLSATRAGIFDDQERLRENLTRVSSDSDLYRRYLQKLDTQENQLEELNAELKQGQRDLEEATARLADYIARLKL
ncbi:MAG: DUF4139 domain-containing protein [Gammaproteobacteria bacterium]